MMIQSSIDRRSRIPLHVIGVDITTGGEVVLSQGPAVEALLASCSTAGVPAVVRVDTPRGVGERAVWGPTTNEPPPPNIDD
jgi:predicted acylesterase/phospholipase RssA